MPLGIIYVAVATSHHAVHILRYISMLPRQIQVSSFKVNSKDEVIFRTFIYFESNERNNGNV